MPSIKKAEDAAAAQAAADRQDRLKKEATERYVFEKRVLTLCTATIVLIAVLWTVAISTDHWYEMDAPPGGVYLRGSQTVLISGHTGLWKMCSEQFHPANLTAYESMTTTVAPVVTTRRPRAQPCKRMGLRGRKRKRCRQFITTRFRSGLSARRKVPAPSLVIPQAGVVAEALPSTTPRTPDYEDGPVEANITDFLGADFDEQTNHADEATPDPTFDEEAVLGPIDPEKEKYLQLVEEEILERIEDGAEDDLTVNETLAEALEEAIEEITSPTFQECRFKELTESSTATDLEWRLLSYMRTLATFSVVSILLLVLGFLSALYTFKEPRYTFKRLSAGIQFISFCGLLVVIQVFRNAALYEQDLQLGGVPLRMGYSQVLAWVSLAGQLVSSFFFLLYSRKKKRNKAPNEEVAMADEPTIIGR